LGIFYGVLERKMIGRDKKSKRGMLRIDETEGVLPIDFFQRNGKRGTDRG